MKLSENIKTILKNDKNKMIIIVLVFVLGVLFLVFPTGEKKTVKSSNDYFSIEKIREKEEKRLEEMLSQMKGVEKAYVYISYKDSGTIDVVTEEKDVTKKGNEDKEIQSERKPVYNSDKNTVVKKLTAPTINGVCVFYKGDDSKNTQDKLSKAVKGALGIEIFKIEVAVLK